MLLKKRTISFVEKKKKKFIISIDYLLMCINVIGTRIQSTNLIFQVFKHFEKKKKQFLAIIDNKPKHS